MAKTINGTTAADTIKVTESDVTVNAGAGKDTIIVSKGSRNVIHGDAGNDTIIVESGAGTGNKLYGDAGDDIIKAQESSKSVTVYGGDGKDTIYGGIGSDVLYGQGGDDKLYGGAGNDKLSGGSGADYLSGGTGDDTLVGGAGKDTFVHYQTYGNDTITDYTAGEDLINIASGSVSKTTLVNSGKDVKFNVGSGSVTVQNVAGKAISLQDSRGSYTASGTEIVLGSDFTGELDTAAYLATVVKVEGAASGNAVNIKGNAKANKLYGGAGTNKLYGYDGNDELYGREGNDYLYGGTGDDKLYGGAGNDKLSGGSGADYLSGGTGDDTLVGGAGKDTFVHYQTYGNDTITDYTAGEDLINIASGSVSKTTLVNSGKDVKFNVGSGSVTVQNGAGKAISLQDSRGSYTASGTEIVLGSDFTGELDTEAYLATVVKVEGAASGNAVNIKGNAKANKLYGGAGTNKLYGYDGNDELNGREGNDYLYGGTGDDKLYGGAGNDKLSGGSGADYLSGGTGDDTLVGGAGKDTFVHYQTYGNDTITDYTAGEDLINIASGSISKTTVLSDSNAHSVTWQGDGISLADTPGSWIVIRPDEDTDVSNDVVFTIGNGSVMVNNGADKVISIKDSHGSYTVSNESIVLGPDYSGVMDANVFFDTVTEVDAEKAAKSVTLKGNVNNNILRGGAGNDILYGGMGNDILYGGAGKDEFVYEQGNNTIFDFESGIDVVRLLSDGPGIDKSEIFGNDVVLTFSNGGTVTLKNKAGQSIDYYDANGELHSVTAAVTQQSIIKSFMKSLDETAVVVASDALNTAVNFASHGFFPTWDSLIERFVSDVRSYGGTAEDGRGYKAYYSPDNDDIIKMPESTTDAFLKTYCGIDLTNEDTGSITGADTGGAGVKTAETIMPPETGTLASAQYPVSDKVIGKLTIKWPEMETLSVTQKTIIAGLDTYWIDAALNLVEESYGITYPKDGNVSFTMNVNFYTNSNSSILASASANSLNINMYYWDEMNSDNINGVSPGTDFYFDRLMAHELTHAVMSASLYNYNNIVIQEDGTRIRDGFALSNNLSEEYSCVNEGLAELTHGIDDERFVDICKLAQASNADQLHDALTDSSDYYRYAGGYMLFRYLAKQAAENYFSADSSVSSNILSNSVMNPITTASSSLWSETTAAVADTGSELASAMTSVSNAMLTPLDSTANSLIGLDSLASGLFSDKKNSVNFLD